MNGYIVIGFENPYSLIDYISEYPKNLKFIIIDYGMPQMNGNELANQIHEINPGIHMAFITGYDRITSCCTHIHKLQFHLLTWVTLSSSLLGSV